MGDVSGAKEDLYESIKILPSLTQSWVKIASVHMEQGEGTKAFECFEEAIKHNSQDPDIYYHRGQGEWLDFFAAIPRPMIRSPLHYQRVQGSSRQLHQVQRAG